MTTALSTGIRRAAARIAPDPAPDGQLLSRFLQSRDEAAFAALVRRHAPMVLGTCRRVLGNAPDADDAFQAAFVVLMRKAHSLTDRACVGNFLYGVAFHTALKARAMATKRRTKEARATRPEPAAEADELTRVLDEELATLPDKYREPVVLCELEGVSRRDAAGRLNVPEGTISSRLATAHRMLEKRLKARGFAAAGVAAVLANQASASMDRASDRLADLAVRSALTGPPAGITHLASEVTKMLLLNKLKAGTAVLAGVLLLLGVGAGVVQRGTAADDRRVNSRAPVPKKDDKPKDDATAIRGTWVVTELHQVGKKMTDEEKKFYAGGGYKITFTADTMTHEVDQSGRKYRLDPAKEPKQLQLLDGDAVVALAIYELKRDDLKVCMGRTPEKGMSPVAPTGFDIDKAPAGTFPTLFVMKRDHPKAKAGAAKAKADDAAKLRGKWVTAAVSFDPPMRLPPGARQELALHTLTFTDTDLTWESVTPSDPKTRSAQTKPFTLDQTTSPKQLTSGDNDCVYELDGDTLKVAMNFLTPGRPKGFNAADSPPGKGHVWVIELTREKDEKDPPKAKPAEKQADADKSYSLKAGQVLKLIPAPFPDGREEVFKQVNRQRSLGGGPKDYRMVIPVEGGSYLWQCGAATSGDTGWPLWKAFEMILGVDRMDCVAGDATLDRPFNADALVERGLSAEKLLPALQAELKAKCGLDVRLEFREVEREVVVASGTYATRAAPNQIEPRHEYTLDTDEPKGKPNWGSHVFNQGFLPAIGSYVRRPVIDETNLKALPDISFSLNEFHHQRPDDSAFKAPDVGAVLKRLADQSKLTFKLEKRKVRALVVEQPKQDKQPEADNSYSLKAGEVLKLIPAPFPDARAEVFKLSDGRHPFPSADDCLMAVTVDKDKGQPAGAHPFTNRRTPGADAPGRPLASFLENGLRIDLTKLVDPAGLLESTILDADVVLKKGAASTDLLTALRKELKAKCGVDLVLEYRETETQVVGISGEHTLNPAPAETGDPRVIDQASVIHLYASEKQEHANTLIANTRAFPRELAKFLGRPVIDQSDLGKNAVLVKTTFHLQHPATDKTRAADRDPEKVLQNVSNQTGLVFKLEKRKVRALVVEQAKKADEPATDKDYSLAAGEVLKLLPAPFPVGREKVFAQIPASKRTGSPIDTNLLAVSVGDGSDEVSEFAARRWKAGEPVKPPQLLHFVRHLLGIDTATVSDPTWLLESTVLDADVVFRKGAKPDELLAALSRELKTKYGADVTFAVREAEAEVVVLGGKHTLKRNHALPGRPYNDAAWVTLTDKPLAGSGGRRSAHLPADLATFVGRPVVDESDLKSNDVAVWITTPSYDTRPKAADRDPATVLKRFAEQTGVTAKLEKRKVRTLVVEQAEVKK